MQECIQLLSNIFVQQKESEANEPKQKQAVAPSSKRVKEPAVALKAQQSQTQMKKSILTKEEEDFQKLLRASWTRSSVSSQQQPKSKGKACKERTPLDGFVNNSKRAKKASRSGHRQQVQRKGSDDINHIKLIPQLFNESDTMISKDAQRSKEFPPATDRRPPKQTTLADMILPKSKLNPSKE